MTEIGELDQRITLQAPTKTRTSAGGVTIVWSDMATVWAKQTVHRSDEAIQSMKETGTATINWRIRFRRGVRGSWRIKFGEQYMAIIGPPMEVNEGGGKHWLDIVCQESA